MEWAHSQANQANPACPSALNGEVTVLPGPFHHKPFSSQTFKVSPTPPEDNIALCMSLSLSIEWINSLINVYKVRRETKLKHIISLLLCVIWFHWFPPLIIFVSAADGSMLSEPVSVKTQGSKLITFIFPEKITPKRQEWFYLHACSHVLLSLTIRKHKFNQSASSCLPTCDIWLIDFPLPWCSSLECCGFPLILFLSRNQVANKHLFLSVCESQ